jgi:hypothetical protein|tara:strand:- start:9447 stop:9656 length:210 start_codon:yes stop_codon:yes gene_type:complete
MTLTYWAAAHVSEDHGHYNVRERTRKAALAKVEKLGAGQYRPVRKVVVTYRDSHSLMQRLLSGPPSEWA